MQIAFFRIKRLKKTYKNLNWKEGRKRETARQTQTQLNFHPIKNQTDNLQ